ncbi:MAG: hypothetical protein ICV83_17450 [Cytophagales bacterium]|nr:hypothetical protein [Cytophagales bacterium]
MKTLSFALALLTGSFLPLLAQPAKPSSQPYATTTMNVTQQTKAELFEVIRNAFPGARSVTDGQLKQHIDNAWQKGLHYGFKGPDAVGSYVIAAYALGENFDREMPEAAALLQDASLTSGEKADRLEALAQDAVQALMQGGGHSVEERVDAGVEAMLAEEAARQARGDTTDPADPYHDYYETQRISQPYRLVAEWAVDKLRKGDLEAVLKRFSPNIMQEVGRPRVEAIFREKVVPFFQASMEVSDSVEVGKAEFPNGAEGYGFMMHQVALRRTKPYIGSKPFAIMVVQENGQLLIAGVDVEREQAHQDQ